MEVEKAALRGTSLLELEGHSFLCEGKSDAWRVVATRTGGWKTHTLREEMHVYSHRCVWMVVEAWRSDCVLPEEGAAGMKLRRMTGGKDMIEGPKLVLKLKT